MTSQDKQNFPHSHDRPISQPGLEQLEGGRESSEQISSALRRQELLFAYDQHTTYPDTWETNKHAAPYGPLTQNTRGINFFGMAHTDAALPYVLPPASSESADKPPRAPSNPNHRRGELLPATDPLTHRVSGASLSGLKQHTQGEAQQEIASAGRPVTIAWWKRLIGHPVVKLIGGLLIGIALLFFVSTLVNLPKTLHVIQQELATPRGVLSTIMASIVFLLAFVFRAMRWKLFLNPVGRIKKRHVIQLFMVGVFLNFLVPIRIGELAKGVILKRTANIPIGQSLSTVTMDKVFDLLPALFIATLVPLLHVQLDTRFWLVLILANGTLLGMVVFVILAAWKQKFAFTLLHRLTQFLPHKIGGKIEGFAVGFVEAVLMSARRPKVFLMAAGITVIAVCFDGLYNYFSFWAIGYPITFGEAVFGYMVFNIFYILPNPPGQVGSNEVVGLFIFHGLLHIPAESVLAMIGLFHVWSGILMCSAGMISLSSLGLTLSSTMKLTTSNEQSISIRAQTPDK